jgi:SAM-dependent methyltransferase
VRDKTLRNAVRRLLMHTSPGRRLVWRLRLRTEVDFWADWLAGAPGTEQWAADRARRLDPTAEIEDPLVVAELERIAASDVAILDVGAGPLTALGYRYPGKRITLVAVDPLATEYDRLLDRCGLDPPVRTILVSGEELSERFGSARFDIAYAVNALDHSADPLEIISNMVAVVRPGGAVLLRHKRNEGQSAHYCGLHQWNFDAVEGDLVLWNNAVRLDVGAALAERAATSASASSTEVFARLLVS